MFLEFYTNFQQKLYFYGIKDRYNIDFVTFFLVFINSSLEVSVVSKWLTFLLIGRSVELDWQTFYLLTIYFEYFLCCFPSVFQL